jgi:hypothetical protein
MNEPHPGAEAGRPASPEHAGSAAQEGFRHGIGQPGRAVFCLSMKMEGVLLRPTLNGFQRRRTVQTGTAGIDRVYNSMPPAHGQIYPEQTLEPVTDWTDFPQPA